MVGKDPDAGKDWEQEEKGAAEDEVIDGITDTLDMSLSKLQEIKDREAWSATIHCVVKSQIRQWLNNNMVQTYAGSCISTKMLLSTTPTSSGS